MKNKSATVGANRKLSFNVLVASMLLLAMIDPAFAQIQVVNDKMALISTVLKSIAVITVVIGVTIVGYQMIFKKAAFSDLLPVIIGAILVAAASSIGAMLVGGA